MRDSKTINIVAGLTTLAASAILFLAVYEWPPSGQVKADAATGWVMAQEALRLLKPGGVINVITRDTSAFKHPATDIQLASFQRTLRKAGVAIATVQTLQADPLHLVKVPADDFCDVIRTSPAGSVIVSFMGPPMLTPEQRSRLGEIKSRIVAFCSGSLPERVDLQILCKQQLLDVAIVSRREAPRSAVKPHSIQEWFDRSYQVITAANVASVYLPAGTPP